MLVAALVAALGAITVAGILGHAGVARPVFGGMVGPLAAVVATWIVTVRTYRRDRAAVMGVMVMAFLAKAVFFAIYVVVMIKLAELPARSFGFSFLAFFIGLYAIEAAYLARLVRAQAAGSH